MKTQKVLELAPHHLKLAGENWLNGDPMNEDAAFALSCLEQLFEINPLQACLIAGLFAATERRSNLDEREIRERVQKLWPEADGTSEMTELKSQGWVEVSGESRRGGREYVMSPGFAAYLKTGDERFLEYCEEPMGDPLLNECLSWHKKGGPRGSRYEVRGFQPLETIVNHHNHPMMRHLRKHCADIRQQTAALFILGYEVVHGKPVGVKELLGELIPQPLPLLLEQAAWQNPRSRVYQNDVLVPSLVIDKKVIEVSLTPGFKKRFLPAVLRKTNSNGIPESPHYQIIRPENISPVTLVYPEPFQRDLDTFLGHLAPERLQDYLQDLRYLGLRPSMTVMLYGTPGTGKTELVQQLAKQYNRVLLMVNLQGLREMWFGESERNVSALFESLRAASKELSQPPIVLFNEADGFFHSRGQRESNSTQTENALITLFLNELERFEGILFGTSNHPGSMDPAFERRWSIKLEVPQPDEKVRIRLLQTKLKGLITASDWGLLARKYMFTPAQLDNVVRKLLFLSAEDRSMDFLDRLLAQETGGWQGSISRIGY
jgi:hypothetical protein